MGVLLPSKYTIAGSFASKMGAGPFSGSSAPDRGREPAQALNPLMQSAGPGLCTSKIPGFLIAASRPQTSPRPPFITAGVAVTPLLGSPGWRKSKEQG